MELLESFDEQIRKSLDLLKSRHVIFEEGLSNQEVERTEGAFGFRFPPDLRAFLQTALPVSIEFEQRNEPFPNWRSGGFDDLQQRLAWPFEGMAFDIENNAFWLDDWGEKPIDLRDAVEIARQVVASAPRLIPIYSHRFLPAEPLIAGNPVFSVYQTDIIYYGCDLWNYFANEFSPQQRLDTPDDNAKSVHRPIRLWSPLVEIDGGRD